MARTAPPTATVRDAWTTTGRAATWTAGTAPGSYRVGPAPDGHLVHDDGVPNRVLIADDDRAIRDPFDAHVLDGMMPDVDGLGVCRVLRADGDRTPILVLSPSSDSTIAVLSPATVSVAEP